MLKIFTEFVAALVQRSPAPRQGRLISASYAKTGHGSWPRPVFPISQLPNVPEVPERQ